MAELLLPAGNFNKLKTAFHFGADAVYFGGREFSLRAFADNFGADEIAGGIAYAHNLNKRVYVTANIFAKNSDLEAAAEYFKFLEDCSADGVIISDPGLIFIAKNVAPKLNLHLSTQANTLNKSAVEFWKEQGIKRVVLARELSAAEIAEIHGAVPGIELEAFVHGAMCMSYSGRCMLSSYFTGRSANRGECVQPCRWLYKIADNKQDLNVSPLEVSEDNRGAYFMNSRDLCLVRYLPELEQAGVCSFKVEGRMKSEFYVATAARAYRKAIDEYATCGSISNPSAYIKELESVSHRPYTDGFISGFNDDTFSYDENRIDESFSFCGVVLNECGGVYEIEMRNRFKCGDSLTVMSAKENREFTVSKIFTSDGSATDDAKLVQHHYKVAIPFAVTPGDLIVKKLI